MQVLYGDPEFASILVFAPEHHYSDADKTEWLFHDLNTGIWCWEAQVHGHKTNLILYIESGGI